MQANRFFLIEGVCGIRPEVTFRQYEVLLVVRIEMPASNFKSTLVLIRQVQVGRQ